MLEPIEDINRRLEDHYGRMNDHAKYRVVWSNDQKEKRFGHWEDYLPEGLFIRAVSEVREVPKYVHIHDRFVLERLVENPHHDENVDGAPIDRLTYEPIWTFEDKHGNALPPAWIACKYVVDHVHKMERERGIYTRHKEPTVEEAEEAKRVKLKEYTQALFGNESDVTDALRYKEGIVVPGEVK